MKNYKVRIQVHKTYDVWIDAEDNGEAYKTVYQMNFLDIERLGELNNVQIDNAEIQAVEEDYNSDPYDNYNWDNSIQ